VRLVWVVIPIVLIGIIGIQESLGDQASGKPAWVTNSDKVCGDRLCSDIQDSNEEILNAQYLCEDTYGKWISGHNECETAGYGNTTEAFQSYCKEFNGDYTYCHSGCRNVEGFDEGKVFCAAQCVQVCEFSVPTAKIFSPKKQMATGVTVFDVVCREGLQLIFKSTNGYPACVKSSTAEKLIERGWTSPIIENSNKAHLDIELDPILYSGASFLKDD